MNEKLIDIVQQLKHTRQELIDYMDREQDYGYTEDVVQYIENSIELLTTIDD